MERRLNSRADFEALALELLNPLKGYYSEEGARLDLGVTAAVYDQNAVWAEAFIRPLWALVPLWAGGSTNTGFGERYRKGLAAGTNPKGKEYWGGFQDIDQRFVEMAAVACGLLMTPEVIWEPLSEQEKQNLARWLDGINHYECAACNWKFFGVLVNLALKSCGLPYDKERLEDYLDYIEGCYEGNGWYVDGQNGEKDYYVSFAFHYYGLLYAKFMKNEDGERCAEYRRRATVFGEEFVYWFTGDGSALPYGRSLTYRMAQVSFFSMCVAQELEVLPYPVMKGLIVRHLLYWMDLPIRDRDGILTIGYGYPNLLMSEQYNAPGSPYWGMKAFAFLSLPEQHTFWKLEAAPLPELDKVRVLSNGSMMVQRVGGTVNAYVTGRRLPHHHVHVEEKYSKFVYSTSFGFSVPRSLRTLEEAAPDNVLAVEYNGMIYTKGITENAVIKDNVVTMEWSPCGGIRVETRISLLPDGHRREHRIQSEQSCHVVDCGFAIPHISGTEWEQSREEHDIVVRYESGAFRVHGVRQENGAPGKAVLIHATPNTNLLHPKTVIPGMRYEVKPGIQMIVTDFTECRGKRM